MTFGHTLTRRTLLKTAAAAAATAALRPRWALSAVGNAPAITAPLSLFGYGDVELLDGPVREQKWVGGIAGRRSAILISQETMASPPVTASDNISLLCRAITRRQAIE